MDADKAITSLSVKASDITALEEAISKLSASFADTTEFTSLYRNTKDWIAQILVGEEFGDADSQDNVDAFVNTINSIRQNTNTYQPKKAELIRSPLPSIWASTTLTRTMTSRLA